jgi:hypothetical protein
MSISAAAWKLQFQQPNHYRIIPWRPILITVGAAVCLVLAMWWWWPRTSEPPKPLPAAATPFQPVDEIHPLPAGPTQQVTSAHDIRAFLGALENDLQRSQSDTISHSASRLWQDAMAPPQP